MEQQKGGPRAEEQQKQGNATGVGNLGGVFCSKQQELPAHLISQEDQHSPFTLQADQKERCAHL